MRNDLKDKFILMPENLITMVCMCRENLDHCENKFVELILFEMSQVGFKMEALTRQTRNAFQCTCFIWLLFLIALNTKAATISLNTNISVEKHYSSLKPHFTLTILPPSPPVFHFAAFWSPFAPHGESRTLHMSCLTLLKTKKAQKV